MTLVRGLADAATAAARKASSEAVAHVCAEADRLLEEAASFATHRALLRFVVRLTLAPRSMQASHLEPLRDEGYSDREIHDVVNVVSCFSYMNRLADGLGVTAHPEPGGWAERLLGVERTEQHRRWAAAR